MSFPDFDPVALQIGPIAIRWYALAYIAGLFGGWFIIRKLAVRPALWGNVRPPPPLDIDDLVVAAAIGVILGGRLGHVLFYEPDRYLNNPVEIFKVWEGGMAFHGGIIGCAVAVLLFGAWRRLSRLSLLDLCSAVAPLGLFLGRIANFINGELWGRVAPEGFPFGVVFPYGGPALRHPSQLYEAFAEGVLLGFVMIWAVRRFGFRRPGLVGGIFLVGYAFARTACEFFREPDAPPEFLFQPLIEMLGGGVTMGMLLCAPMALAGCWFIWLARSGRTTPTPPSSDNGTLETRTS